MRSTLRYSRKYCTDYRRTSMYMQLKQIFSSDGVGTRKVEDECAGVEDRCGRGWKIRTIELTKGSIPRLWKGS